MGEYELKQVLTGCVTSHEASGNECGEYCESCLSVSKSRRLFKIGLGGEEVFNGAVVKGLCK